MQNFFDLSYEELIILATALGLATSDKLTVNQQNILGNFLQLVGQVILVSNSVGSSYPPNSNGPNAGPDGVGSFHGCYKNGYTSSAQSTSVNDLLKKINVMEEELEKLKNKLKNE